MDKQLIVVTGGSGYIGSHTIIELIVKGFDVVSIDNFSRSSSKSFEFIKKITGQEVKNFEIDLCNREMVEETLMKLPPIAGVIHFAAFKSVPESVSDPDLYYRNNIFSLLNILDATSKKGIKNFVFSSSCSVYGNINELPVSEQTVLGDSNSPYASTKVMGEKIVRDVCMVNNINSVCLRYFNPVGAHPSGLIGEMPLKRPDNLVPVITQTAIGKRKSFTVFGGKFPTRDGSCIRDYVHVMDIASAHVLALQYLSDKLNLFEIINLGTGQGVSVFEAINTFEMVSGVKLNYIVGEPREGDVIEIYSDVTKAKELLGWTPRYSIDEMMLSAWKWEKQLSLSEVNAILV